MTTDNLKQLCHLLGGLLIMLLSFQFYEAELEKLLLLYLCAGVFFLLVGLFPRPFDAALGRLSALLFLVEAAALFYAARVQHDEDDSILVYIVNAAALGYVMLTLYFLFVKKTKRVNKRSGRSRRIVKPG